MRRALAALVLVGLSGPAVAESGWLSARGRLLPETRVEAFVGTRSFGVGVLRTDDGNPRAGLALEGVVTFVDRVAELRGARVWQLSQTRFGTASASLGASAFIVPQAALDLGLGPHAALNLSLGGQVFSVDLGLQTGVEFFLRQQGAPRLPQRALVGLNLRVSEFLVSAMARVGVDLVPGRNFVGRGEVMLSVGWLGLDALLGRGTPAPPR